MRRFAMSIRPADLLAQIESHQAPTIVDVRSHEEYAAGHVPGALHIPFWAIGSRVSELRSAADRAVVVYGGHGPRAWMAGAVLGLRGFRNLIYLEGHWAAWQRQGLREDAGGRGASAEFGR
jgi:rhodanese-related sulfurtransferase